MSGGKGKRIFPCTTLRWTEEGEPQQFHAWDAPGERDLLHLKLGLRRRQVGFTCVRYHGYNLPGVLTDVFHPHLPVGLGLLPGHPPHSLPVGQLLLWRGAHLREAGQERPDDRCLLSVSCAADPRLQRLIWPGGDLVRLVWADPHTLAEAEAACAADHAPPQLFDLLQVRGHLHALTPAGWVDVTAAFQGHAAPPSFIPPQEPHGPLSP